jgi:hypothetical protein
LVVAALQITPAFAATESASSSGFKIDSLAAGASMASTVGESYSYYSGGTGFNFEALVANSGAIGESFRSGLDFEYHPYAILGTGAVSLKQYDIFVVIRSEPSTPSWLRPFASFGLGAQYNYLAVNSSSAFVQDAATILALQFKGGFDVPIGSSFGLRVALPLTLSFDTKMMETVGGNFSLYWKL